MKKGKVFALSYKRKRQGRTYYKKRLRLLLSDKFRLVVRKSLNNLHASIIKYSAKGDKVLVVVDSRSLLKLGWKGGNGNLPCAYLVGLLVGKKAIEKGIDNAVLDLGFNKSAKGSRLYATLAGVVDAGLKIPFNPEVLPSKERLSGEHIARYAQALKSDKVRYERQFSNYIKKRLNPEDIVKHFNDVKGNIHA